jgi:hypothetical protein
MDARVRWVYKRSAGSFRLLVTEEKRFIMASDDTQKQDAQSPGGAPAQPDLEHLNAALTHVDEGVKSGSIAAGAARGLVYSLVETLGALVGDPDLPEHARSGYQGLLEAARELRVKLERAPR